MQLPDIITRWLERRRRRIAEREAQAVRHIPDSYFEGYRRLAPTRAAIIGQHCWNCRHAIGHVSWWCDLDASKGDADCKWQPCYVADELTRADLERGKPGEVLGQWIPLPPEPKNGG